MKKLIALALALCMLVALCGCKPQQASNPTPTPGNSTPTPASKAPDDSTPAPTLDYPKDTVHIVVTFSAGGGNDVIARAVASGMESIIGQSVVVDNITGGGGMTGSFEVVNSDPDGLQILCQDASLTSSLVTQGSEAPFSLDDLIPVSAVYTCPTWALSHSDNGYETLQDFVDDAKANPGTLTIGTAVTGGCQYLMACAIVNYFDLDVTIIPYEGGNELKAAVLGNHVDMGIIHSPILLPEVQNGDIKVLVAGDDLSGIGEESLRDVKTLADYGMDTTFSSTRGFLVPKDTPAEIVSYLESAFEQALDTDVVKEFATTFGYQPHYRNSEEYAQFLQEEMSNFSEVFAASVN